MGEDGWVPPGASGPVVDDGSVVASGATRTTTAAGEAPATGESAGAGPRTGSGGPTRRRWAGIAAGVVLVALAGAVGVAVTGGGGTDRPGSRPQGAPDDAGQQASGPTTAAPATTTTVPPWRPVVASDGAFSLEVPSTWVFASLRGDPATVAQSLYPDRPEAAASMGAQQMVMTMQCSGCHSIGIDATRENFAGMPTLVKVETEPGVGVIGLDAAIAAARAQPDPVGMVAGEDGRLTSPVGEVAWLDFTIPAIEVSGRRYFMVVGEDLWWLTYMDPWNDPDRVLADRIALSFAPGATVVPPAPG